MRQARIVVVALVGALALPGCPGDGDGAGAGPTGFVPVRAGSSGFEGGAPQPAEVGRLSVSKTVDGASFFARVEDPGPTPLERGQRARFRLAGVAAPDEAAGDCLAGPATTHLNGFIRGGDGVRFVLAEGADATAEDERGIPVHVWSRRVWVNGEVLARGYGDLIDDAGASRADNAEAAEAFAREEQHGRWSPTLCPSEAPATDDGA